MLEKTIEEILKRYHAEIWPDLSLRFLESQRRLPKGNIFFGNVGDRWYHTWRATFSASNRNSVGKTFRWQTRGHDEPLVAAIRRHRCSI